MLSFKEKHLFMDQKEIKTCFNSEDSSAFYFKTNFNIIGLSVESLQCYIILYPTPKNTCLHFLSNFYWNRRNVLKNQIDKQQFASVFTNTTDTRKRKLNVRLIVVMCHSRQHFVVYLKPLHNVTSMQFHLM